MVEVPGIVMRVDDNFPGGDDSFVLILQPSAMIPERHMQIVNVDVLHDIKTQYISYLKYKLT